MVGDPSGIVKASVLHTDQYALLCLRTHSVPTANASPPAVTQQDGIARAASPRGMRRNLNAHVRTLIKFMKAWCAHIPQPPSHPPANSHGFSRATLWHPQTPNISYECHAWT